MQWVLSGTLCGGLALAPALVPSAFAQSNTAGQQAPAQTPAPGPGQQGNWGPAGPPPDAQNGQIPPPDNAAQDPSLSADQSADQGPSQYPGQAPDPNQTPNQAPSQAPNQYPNQYPNEGPANGPGVGYGQPPRPAYQPGQNQANQYQGPPQQVGPPPGPVTLAAGLLLPVRTSEPLDSRKVKPGDYFQGTVAQSVYVGNVLAIPRGAAVTGKVVEVKKPGELKGGASITLQLTSLSLGGNSYSLATDVFNTSGPGKGGYTAANTVGTAALGAVIGAIAGGGPGAAIGAAAGTGVGLGASAATPGPRSVLPPEALVSFHLTSPATVQPVSAQDAYRLEASSGPPSRRYPPAPYGYAGYPGYPPPPPPAYGYAPGPYAYGPYYGYPYGYPYGRVYYYGGRR